MTQNASKASFQWFRVCFLYGEQNKNEKINEKKESIFCVCIFVSMLWMGETIRTARTLTNDIRHYVRQRSRIEIGKKRKWKCRERAIIYLALNDVVSGALILFLSHFNINNGNNNNENENGKKTENEQFETNINRFVTQKLIESNLIVVYFIHMRLGANPYFEFSGWQRPYEWSTHIIYEYLQHWNKERMKCPNTFTCGFHLSIYLQKQIRHLWERYVYEKQRVHTQ